MKKLLLGLIAGSLFTGCALFKAPSAEKARRNDDAARMAGDRRAEFEREDAMKARAAAYERQGMTREQAWSAAQAESTAPRPGSRP